MHVTQEAGKASDQQGEKLWWVGGEREEQRGRKAEKLATGLTIPMLSPLLGLDQLVTSMAEVGI